MISPGEGSKTKAPAELYEEFLRSLDTLRVYRQGRLAFQSRKGRLQPLLDYLENREQDASGVLVFDRVTGNAAALLLKMALCGEVFSPLGSALGAKTLERHGIAYHFGQMVPFICDAKGTDMCPMERLSIDKSPEEFLVVLRHMALVSKRPRSKN